MLFFAGTGFGKMQSLETTMLHTQVVRELKTKRKKERDGAQATRISRILFCAWPRRVKKQTFVKFVPVKFLDFSRTIQTSLKLAQIWTFFDIFEQFADSFAQKCGNC